MQRSHTLTQKPGPATQSGEILTMLAYGDRLIVALAGLAGGSGSGSDRGWRRGGSGVLKKGSLSGTTPNIG